MALMVSIVTMLHQFSAGDIFPVYNGFGINSRYCITDRDCDSDAGEICWWLYDGCGQGYCVCDFRTHILDSHGSCKAVGYNINRRCTEDDDCPRSTVCINGTCRCSTTSPVMPCMPNNYKFLGQSCPTTGDVCYHEAAYGYSSSEVYCANDLVCRCKEGYKHHRATCRKFHIWESGCSQSFDCEGGAICLDGRCACPAGYKSVADDTKCAKNGAIIELPIGMQCDEIEEKGYCAQGLVCHQCRDTDKKSICVRYLTGLEGQRSMAINSNQRTACLPQLSILLHISVVTIVTSYLPSS